MWLRKEALAEGKDKEETVMWEKTKDKINKLNKTHTKKLKG